MKLDLGKKTWWPSLDEDVKELLSEAEVLINRVNAWDQKFHDYSFVVFPASKAYEGFLKRLFLDLNFINEEDYYGKHFRIGKALNPSLDRKQFSGESVYDKLVDHCGGDFLAKELWETWKTCRNLLFHWFPKEKNAVSLKEAETRVERVVKAIDLAFRECRLDTKSVR